MYFPTAVAIALWTKRDRGPLSVTSGSGGVK